MTTAAPVEGLPRPIWFVASLVLYVVLGLLVKSTVLNWIVGPLWLLITLYLVPLLWRRLRATASS